MRPPIPPQRLVLNTARLFARRWQDERAYREMITKGKRFSVRRMKAILSRIVTVEPACTVSTERPAFAPRLLRKAPPRQKVASR